MVKKEIRIIDKIFVLFLFRSQVNEREERRENK